jgi:hypothetical protein
VDVVNEIFKPGKSAAQASKKKRKRGATLKRKGNALSRGPSELKQRTDTILSARPAPDFEIEEETLNDAD